MPPETKPAISPSAPPPIPANGAVNDSSLSAQPGGDPYDDPPEEDVDSVRTDWKPLSDRKAASKLPPPTIDEEIRAEVFARRWAGIGMGSVGIGAVVLVIWFAAGQINEALLTPVQPGREYLVIVAVAAHALVSIAVVWFGYQMLRAAERMFIPRRFLSGATDVEVLRALVGISAPTTAAAEQIKALTGDLPTIIKALNETVTALRKKNE